MTPLGFFAAALAGSVAGQLIVWLFSPVQRNPELEKRIMRMAFEDGILAAADMATVHGQEELAGNMRKAVANVRKKDGR